MRFIIFKVKKRAKNNYEAVTPTINEFDKPASATNLFSNPLSLERETDIHYSYNWPYDFCSLVEVGKIDAKIKLSPVTPSGVVQAAGLDFPLTKFRDEQKESKE